MSRFVPFLADDVIERDAAALLAEYEHARGITLEVGAGGTKWRRA